LSELKFGDKVTYGEEKCIVLDVKKKDFHEVCRIFFLSDKTTHGYSVRSVPTQAVKNGW
jgi:hypothetical protein